MNENSVAAYRKLVEPFLDESQQTVLDWLRQNPGATQEEADIALGNNDPKFTSAHKRFSELEAMGYVRRGDNKLVSKKGRERYHRTYFAVENPDPHPMPEKPARPTTKTAERFMTWCEMHQDNGSITLSIEFINEFLTTGKKP